MIVDTSVLVSVLFNEPLSGWCAELLEENKNALTMSTVNLCELLMVATDRIQNGADYLIEAMPYSGMKFVPPSTSHAYLAAQARFQFPLNLGDCFAYALAKEQDEPLITLDKDFLKTDIQVICPHSKH